MATLAAYSIRIGLLLILLSFASTPVSAATTTTSRKLDESTAPGVGENCIPCTQASPPPPPPPVPCPPPPALPPPPPPPPALPPPPPPSPPQKPPTTYCPPPPSTYIYIAGPPGNLYPVEQYLGGAGRRLGPRPWLLAGFGLIGVMLLW
ncbi:hypothetical protein MLD38_011385 [Melastoma candidum]|uniref:Uncharacterized protein n=1 Tax=Melastoma candidum TaxID=119954 RepID=A0ACB9RB74_9MYRT|nr:hypothetical protein MLD38_011385 [Melastoma candidum]